MGKSVLIVGSGGRCHALADAFSRSKSVNRIFCIPGNGGIEDIAKCVDIDPMDISAVADFAFANNIDLTVVGPEAVLAAGIAEEFARRGLLIFAPSKMATQIESSKLFAKDIMQNAGVPTASFAVFNNFERAKKYIESCVFPTVIKFDGLAAGKGSAVVYDYKDAIETLHAMLIDKIFGEGPVLIEEFLGGKEFSYMFLVNDRKIYPLAVAKDFKRAYTNDEGPNTGGMGAYSPVPYISNELEKQIQLSIIQPVVNEMADRNMPFKGVLYAGLILTDKGVKVLEFNARFGDPETEVVLPRLKSDFFDFISAVIKGEDFIPDWNNDFEVGIVLAAKGYPGNYKKGIQLRELKEMRDKIYHMGTIKDNNIFFSSGGRVMFARGSGHTLEQARKSALEMAERIVSEDLFYRLDIAKIL